MIKMDLGYIALYVDDLGEIVDWYETQLDLFKVSERDDAVVMAGANGFAVEFREGTPLDNPERVVLAFTTEEPDVIFERWRKGGLPIGSKEMTFGRRLMSVRDPAGHTVQVFEVESKQDVENLTLYRRKSDEES